MIKLTKNTDSFYYDKTAGISFTSPSGWDKDQVSEEEYIKAGYISYNYNLIYIGYGDVTAIFPQSKIAGIKNKDINNDIFSDADIIESYATDNIEITEIQKETVNNIEYFYTCGHYYDEADPNKEVISYILINNGSIYEIIYIGNIASNDFNVYQNLLDSVKYYNSETISDNHIFGYSFSYQNLLGLLLAILIYAIPHCDISLFYYQRTDG